MKRYLSLVIVFAFTACGVRVAESQKSEVPNPPPPAISPVIVELFTSEGCSSCPAAERGLQFLVREQPAPTAEIIPIALHVDYWDYLGWKDPFASPIFSKRQDSYRSRFKKDSSYTPQFVIDGQFEVAGADTAAVTRSVLSAAVSKKAAVTAVFRDGQIIVEISGAGHDDANVMIAIVEDKLTRQIENGENRGRKLEHMYVTRELITAGSFKRTDDSKTLEHRVGFKPDWKRSDLAAVVFVQEEKARKIVGAAKVALGPVP